MQVADSGIFGRVVDDGGKPVRRFSVLLRQQEMSGSARLFNSEDGRFAITDFAPGIYSAYFSSDSGPPLSAHLPELEIKKGFYYGEVVVRLLPYAPAAK
jgi:hypothetical protein